MYRDSILYYITKHICTTNIIKLYFTTMYRGADKSLARSGRKQAAATEDFEFHISYL